MQNYELFFVLKNSIPIISDKFYFPIHLILIKAPTISGVFTTNRFRRLRLKKQIYHFLLKKITKLLVKKLAFL